MYSNDAIYSDQNSFFSGIEDNSAGDSVLEYSRTSEPAAGSSVVAIKDGVCQVVEYGGACEEVPESLYIWGVISSVM